LLRFVELTLKIAAISLLVFFTIQSYHYGTAFTPIEEGLRQTNKKLEKQNEHLQNILDDLHKDEMGSVTIEGRPSPVSFRVSKIINLDLESAYLQALPKDSISNGEGISIKSNALSYKEVNSDLIEVASDLIEAKYVIKLDNKVITTVVDVCYSIMPPDISKPKNAQPDQTNLNSSQDADKKIVLTVIGLDGTKKFLPIGKNWTEEIKKHEGDILSWKPGLCGSVDPQTVYALRKCLKMNLKEYSEAEGESWTQRDKENLSRYQEENGLPTGNTNFETLKKLGFQIHLQCKQYKKV